MLEYLIVHLICLDRSGDYNIEVLKYNIKKVLVYHVEFITFISQSVNQHVKIISFPSHIIQFHHLNVGLVGFRCCEMVPGRPLAEDGVSLDESEDCGMYRLPLEPACRAMRLFTQ